MLKTVKIDRTRPPQTPELPAFKLPPVFETNLENGLEVVLVEDRRFPLVTLRLGFEAGSKFDPPELAGLSESAAALLPEGTSSRNARQIAEEIASIGGSLHGDSTADSLLIQGNALAENLPVLLRLVSDIARNAIFPEDEVALRKQNRAQELLAQRSHPSFLASERFSEVVFGEHPYARQEPTLASVERLNREALTAFRDRHVLPQSGVLVLLGALPDRSSALGLIERAFAGWQGAGPPAAPAAAFPRPARRVVVVNRPGSVQADIRAGKRAVNRADPDYFPLLIGNTVLGGGASSRLFTNIREKRGYAYDVHSSLQPLKTSGSFCVVTQVRNEVLPQALEAVLEEMDAIGNRDSSPEEITDAKNYLSGVFVIRLETQEGLAAQLAAVKLMGLPVEYLEQYTARVRAVEPGQIQAAAGRYICPPDASIVVVGDAAQIARPLERFGDVVVEEVSE